MRRFFLLFTCLVFSQITFAQNFKTVGYLPHYRFSWLNDIEFERLTHVNIAFANPDMQGNLSCEGVNIAPAVQKARQAGCKVFISLAGGYLTPEWEAAWNHLMLPANRAAFIQKIIQYLQTNALDGVDLDLEWQYVNDLYSPFVLDLKAALTPLGYPLTAALPGEHRYPQISAAALAQFDWVNMMIYDLTGPWAPGNPGQHSPYWWAEECIDYWKNQGVPAAKLTLGVPFYGYDFGQSPVKAYTYRYIVDLDVANAQYDQVGQLYYNGIPTIQAKAALAKDKVAGIMIWEIGQDVFGANQQYSLLRAIDEILHPPVVTAEKNGAGQIRLFPNPARDWVSVEVPENQNALLRIFDLRGNAVLEENLAAGEQKRLDVSHFPAGGYCVFVSTKEGTSSGYFMKMNLH